MTSLCILWLVCGSLVPTCNAVIEDSLPPSLDLSIDTDQNQPPPEAVFNIWISIRQFVGLTEDDENPTFPNIANKLDDTVVSGDASSEDSCEEYKPECIPEELFQKGEEMGRLARIFARFQQNGNDNLYETSNQDSTEDEDEQGDKENAKDRLLNSSIPYKVKVFLGALLIIILLYLLVSRLMCNLSQDKNSPNSGERNSRLYQDFTRMRRNACNCTNKLFRSGRNEIFSNVRNGKIVEEV